MRFERSLSARNVEISQDDVFAKLFGMLPSIIRFQCLCGVIDIILSIFCSLKNLDAL